MFNRIATVVIAVVFCLALYDASKIGGKLWEAATLALAPTLLLVGVQVVAVWLGRKTQRRLLLNVALSFVLAPALVAYVSYALTAPGDPDTASHMYVVFFPVLLALFALVVMGVAAAVAYIWPRESNNALEQTHGQ